MARLPIGAEDALIVVDIQNDFCLGGSLPVEGSDEVIETLNEWIHAAGSAGALLVFSRDWHPAEHASFLDQGGQWPRHCVQNSEGAKFHPNLQVPEDAWIVNKGAEMQVENHSAFDGTGLAKRLRQQGVERLWIGGLALDVCVRATVIDACKEGFEVRLIADGTRPIDAKAGTRAMNEMTQAGAELEGRAA